jgi:antitoxin VapB
LAKQLAERTGETITHAVTVSLRERLDRLQGDADELAVRAQALLAIGRDTAWRLQEPGRSVNPDALLYDDAGLPR